jgi:hypothetical protein
MSFLLIPHVQFSLPGKPFGRSSDPPAAWQPDEELIFMPLAQNTQTQEAIPRSEGYVNTYA